jgi:D-alanine-D-alanine ligase
MPDKTRVGILFGGKSAEHEVSLQSAKSIIDAVDTNRFEIVPIVSIEAENGTWILKESCWRTKAPLP